MADKYAPGKNPIADDEGSTGLATLTAPAGNGESLESVLPPTQRFRLPRFFRGDTEAADAENASINGDSSSGFVALPQSDLSALLRQVEDLTDQVRQVNEREGAVERVFNTLHAELADYKNDFLYEHLKPVVRPLLFLFDSLEQFDGEVAMTQAAQGESALVGGLSPMVVRQNIQYFRDQLVEALRVCEVVLMDTPQDKFNPKFHKAVDILPVGKDDDGRIMRVIRSGWFLNGQLLRPAEVVIGKFRAPT